MTAANLRQVCVAHQGSDDIGPLVECPSDVEDVIRRHARLSQYGDDKAPETALSYYQLPSGTAVLLRRTSVGRTGSGLSGSAGRGDSRALYGSASILTAERALLSWDWWGWSEPIDPWRSRDVDPVELRGHDQHLRSAARRSEHLPATLSALLANSDRPIGIWGCPDRDRIVLLWGLREICASADIAPQRQFTFSTYEVGLEETRGLPEIIFAPRKLENFVAGDRCWIDLQLPASPDVTGAAQKLVDMYRVAAEVRRSPVTRTSPGIDHPEETTTGRTPTGQDAETSPPASSRSRREDASPDDFFTTRTRNGRRGSSQLTPRTSPRSGRPRPDRRPTTASRSFSPALAVVAVLAVVAATFMVGFGIGTRRAQSTEIEKLSGTVVHLETTVTDLKTSVDRLVAARQGSGATETVPTGRSPSAGATLALEPEPDLVRVRVTSDVSRNGSNAIYILLRTGATLTSLGQCNRTGEVLTCPDVRRDKDLADASVAVVQVPPDQKAAVEANDPSALANATRLAEEPVPPLR